MYLYDYVMNTRRCSKAEFLWVLIPICITRRVVVALRHAFFVTGQWDSEIKYFDISSIVLIHVQDLIQFFKHVSFFSPQALNDICPPPSHRNSGVSYLQLQRQAGNVAPPTYAPHSGNTDPGWAKSPREADIDFVTSDMFKLPPRDF